MYIKVNLPKNEEEFNKKMKKIRKDIKIEEELEKLGIVIPKKPKKPKYLL